MTQTINETTNQNKAKFGEKGFRKGLPNNRKGTPRARITARDARLLAFLSQFPGADADTLSLLNSRAETTFSEAGGIVSPKNIKERMRKLERLGAVEKYRNIATGRTHYGVSDHGFEAAQAIGYPFQNYKTLEGMSLQLLNHYAQIALVAAEFASPINYFAETLGIGQVALEDLISETQLRADLSEVNEELRQQGKNEVGARTSFGQWRATLLQDINNEISTQGETINYPALIPSYPALRISGWTEQQGKQIKNQHIPDLVIHLDEARTGRRARNILVEVELSPKTYADYASILDTFALELKHGLVFEQIIYFTVGKQVENLLKRIDRQRELGLFDSGRLTILPLTNREGEAVKPTRRIVIGG